jgi:integrase
VTLLLDLGVPPRVIREIVGHSAIEGTMTIYAHGSLADPKIAELAGARQRPAECPGSRAKLAGMVRPRVRG